MSLLPVKKPRSFVSNGVYVSQSIFPSSKVIRDGTFNRYAIFADVISPFSIESQYVNAIHRFTEYSQLS